MMNNKSMLQVKILLFVIMLAACSSIQKNPTSQLIELNLSTFAKEVPLAYSFKVYLWPNQAKETVGFRIFSAKDKEHWFKQEGLKDGDIIIAVNDVRINDMKSALQCYNMLKNNNKVKVLVSRAGEWQGVLRAGIQFNLTQEPKR